MSEDSTQHLPLRTTLTTKPVETLQHGPSNHPQPSGPSGAGALCHPTRYLIGPRTALVVRNAANRKQTRVPLRESEHPLHRTPTPLAAKRGGARVFGADTLFPHNPPFLHPLCSNHCPSATQFPCFSLPLPHGPTRRAAGLAEVEDPHKAEAWRIKSTAQQGCRLKTKAKDQEASNKGGGVAAGTGNGV